MGSGAEQDQSTPPEKSRGIAQRIPGAELVIIATAAHLANLEQLEAVTSQILGHFTMKEDRDESR